MDANIVKEQLSVIGLKLSEFLRKINQDVAEITQIRIDCPVEFVLDSAVSALTPEIRLITNNNMISLIITPKRPEQSP